MKKLTWNDLATLYNERNPSNRSAQTLPMDAIVKWAEQQPDIVVNEEDTFCQLARSSLAT